MPALEKSLRESLWNTAKTYHNQLKEHDDAMEYLTSRGLAPETVKRFGVGFVGEPVEEEDAPFQGRISIPYLVKSHVHGWSCVGFKFRKISGDGPKYLYRKGLSPKIFNPVALDSTLDFICIAEGEIDAISADQCGLPCIGIPGATYWEKFYSRLFTGYRAVILLQDNDPPPKNGEKSGGEKMADLWSEKLRGIANFKVIKMTEDVNADMNIFGMDYVRSLVE